SFLIVLLLLFQIVPSRIRGDVYEPTYTVLKSAERLASYVISRGCVQQRVQMDRKADSKTFYNVVLQNGAAALAYAADFIPLVAGISSVYVVGVPGPLWALSENVVPIVSGDEDTTPIPSVVAAATLFGNGRVVALGHEGFLTNEAVALFDNKKFGINIVKWLDKYGTKKVLVTIGHREWLGGENFENFKRELESLGYTVTRFSGRISASVLSGVGVVLIGNAWGDFTREEVEELQSFVYKGGGLLLMGLGWSWEPYNPGRTLDDYPMNKIGEVFGIRWIDGCITDPTNSYNGQPLFHTFYPNIKLQTLYQAFSYIKAVTEAHPTDLPTLLQTNATLRRDYVNAHLLLATASRVLSASSNASLKQRREIYDFYKELISSNPQYFRKNVVFDRSSQSVMAWLRERVYRSFIDALPLTEDVKSEVALTIGLTGRYLDVWKEFTVLLLDNNGLDQRQLDFIYALLRVIPRELHNLRAISVTDFLGELPPSTPEIYLRGKEGGVNVFGSRIGEYSENGFPEDVPPKYSDVFCIVVAHEVNHVVDAFYISRNAALRSRRDELVKRAGSNHLNYLRSMLPDGFFTSNPQEFFASISNQWFSDSALTLKLALARFDKGYKEPLNQFLFFAEVYSRGGNGTLFYSIDTHGNLRVRVIPLVRDQKGRIVALKDGDTWYLFTLDEYGYAQSYTVRKELARYTVSIDVRPKVSGIKVDGVQYTPEQIPLSFEWEEGSNHALQVIPTIIDCGNWTRRVFDGWYEGGKLISSELSLTFSVNRSRSLEARWRTQYFVTASTPYSTVEGEGWYSEGVFAEVRLTETEVGGPLVRYVFDGWEGLKPEDRVLGPGVVSVYVDRPRVLRAVWRADYSRAYALAFILMAGVVAVGFLVFSRRRGTTVAATAAAMQPPSGEAAQPQPPVEKAATVAAAPFNVLKAELEKYEEYLKRLEDLKAGGRISEQAYQALKSEYEAKVQELKKKLGLASSS
ncbi:MAG: hypothetical protein LM576_07515, partial [Thermofilum sp.]|nr:hypothetical protein [Thermofilum sp.]